MSFMRSCTYKAKRVYTFNGVKYLKRKDASDSFSVPVKLQNGRYYVSLEKYKHGRTLYLKRQFLWSVEGRLRRKRDILSSWKRIVKNVLHRQGCQTLIATLRTHLRIIQSRLYARVRDILMCTQCNGHQMKYRKGPCECHLCEDWFGCGGRDTRCPDLLACLSCGYTKSIVRKRLTYFPYRYAWHNASNAS